MGLQIKKEKIKTSLGVQRKSEKNEKNGKNFGGGSLGGSSAKNDHRVRDLFPEYPEFSKYPKKF